MPAVPAPEELAALFQRCHDLYFERRPAEGLVYSTRGVHTCRALNDKFWLRKFLTAKAIFETDLHSFAQAFVTLAEVEGLCHELGDPVASSVVWNNMSGTLAYAEAPDMAISAAQLALKFASEVPELSQRIVCRATALSNITYVCLFSKRHGQGLRATREIEDLFEQWKREGFQSRDPNNAVWILPFAYKARLLLRVNVIDEARPWTAVAEAMAVEAEVPQRFLHFVEMTKALCDAYSGRYDAGVAKLNSLASSSALLAPVVVTDVLRDLCEVHTVGRRPELAALYSQELARTMQQVRGPTTLIRERPPFNALAMTDREPRSARTVTLPHASFLNDADHDHSLRDLCAAAEICEDSSGLHPQRVEELAFELALVAGSGQEFAREVANAARLHDLGKIGVSPSILSKRGALDEAETEIMHSHAEIGAEMLAHARITNRRTSIAVARHHHEWWSGSGYPAKLRGDQIPLEARITAIAESFDAMTHDRPYRPKMSLQHALSVIAERAGTQFDPSLAPLLPRVIHRILADHGNLDAYLERNARESSFLRAKRLLSSRMELGSAAHSVGARQADNDA